MKQIRLEYSADWLPSLTKFLCDSFAACVYILLLVVMGGTTRCCAEYNVLPTFGNCGVQGTTMIDVQ